MQTPVYFALGAARWGQDPQTPHRHISREVSLGTLSMDSIGFHP